MKEYALEAQNIYCMKSWIEGHRIQQLGIFVDSALLYWLGYLAGGFYALQSRISCKKYFKAISYTLSPCLGLVHRVCNLI